MSDVAPCPFCDAEISVTAKKCRHCGEWIRGECTRCGVAVRGRWAAQSLCADCERVVPATTPQGIQAHYSQPPQVQQKSAITAGCLGLALGPVGLWYKGHWAAGFAWLVMTVILAPTVVALPFCWVGMAIHAAVADTKGP